MSLWQKIKVIWEVSKFLKGGSMNLKSSAAWLKILSYVCLAWSAFSGYLKPEWVIGIAVIISAIDKIAQIIVDLTSSTKDNEIKALIDIELKKAGILK
jgi:hypothetical protein